MEAHKQNSHEILQDAREMGLYDLLISQVKKDFGRANVPISLSEGMAPESFFTTLHEKLYQLLMERFDDYLNVLYVVDVPERSFRNVSASDTVDAAEEVCGLILKRAWQKVLSKQRYG